jgi:serine/threonine protein kinase
LTTGRPPFEGDKPMKVIIAHATEEVTPPSTHRDIGEDLELVILRCLAKDPDRRPQTAEELDRLLDDAHSDPPWTAERAQAWWDLHEPEGSAEALTKARGLASGVTLVKRASAVSGAGDP